MKNKPEPLPKLSENILFIVGRLKKAKISEIMQSRMIEASKDTVKKRLTKLVQTGYLERYGKGKATWYELASSVEEDL
jgi:predicted transcriptional regulator